MRAELGAAVVGSVLLAATPGAHGIERIGFTFDEAPSTIGGFGGSGAAQTFRVAEGGTLKSLEFWMWSVVPPRDPPPAFDLEIYHWNGTDIGAEIWSARVDSLPILAQGTTATQQNTSTLLSTGMVDIPAGDFLIWWHVTGSGFSAPLIRYSPANAYADGRALTRGSGSWVSLGSVNNDLAFIVEVVPAPSGAAVLGMGALAALRRRR
ncbi:MAG: hypothetical protein ACF8SC_02270 [Phycisphaerales bacterium JB037]